MTGPPPGLVDERVELGPFSIVLRRPVDAERLIDEERFAVDEFLPYWAEVWPSGLALAQHVAALNLQGTTVLELGCGLGLPSLAAALAGADVLATDWAPEAIDLIEANAAANGLGLTGGVLAWNDERLLELGRFDLVLAADVLYEKRNAALVLEVLDATVALDGEALIVDPGRRHAPAFFERARRSGWSCGDVRVEPLPRGGITRMRRGRRTMPG